MAHHSWDGYVKYAWGDNELKPVSRRGHSAAIFGKNTKMGATIVDSLDTLYMMGMMDAFNKAKDWVRLSLNMHEVSRGSTQSCLHQISHTWLHCQTRMWVLGFVRCLVMGGN